VATQPAGAGVGFHFLPDSINPQLHQHLVQGGGIYLLPVSHRRSFAPGAVQHQPRCPAAQSGRPGRKYFVGMPIPAAAGLLAATVHFFYGIPVLAWWVAVIWLCLVGLSGFLMVSTWRFWSGKEINFSRRHPFQLLFVLAVVLYIMILLQRGALLDGAGVYVQRLVGAGGLLVVAAAARAQALPAAVDAPVETPSEAPDWPDHR